MLLSYRCENFAKFPSKLTFIDLRTEELVHLEDLMI